MTIQQFIIYMNTIYGPNITYQHIDPEKLKKYHWITHAMYTIYDEGNPLDVFSEYELKALKPNTPQIREIMKKLMSESSLYNK
jgi:hypothetical protein